MSAINSTSSKEDNYLLRPIERSPDRNENETPPRFLKDMPKEIAHKIIDLLGPQATNHLSMTDKHFFVLTNDHLTWKKRLENDFGKEEVSKFQENQYKNAYKNRYRDCLELE